MGHVLPPSVSLKDHLTDLVFCSLDLETTGANPALHKIVEIGMVKFSLNDTLDSFSNLVNPQTGIPQNVIEIHGITNQMVANAPVIADIINDIYAFIGDSILVIHNPRFDLSFLRTIKVPGINIKNILQAIDTVRLSRKTFPGFPNHKLETLCQLFKIGIDTHHRALSDASACKDVFLEVIQNLDPQKNWTISDLLHYHGNFIKPHFKRKVPIADVPIIGITIGALTKIRYKDSDGKITTREILPKQFVRVGGKQYVYAYCNLRNEHRYFKANRIIEIVK